MSIVLTGSQGFIGRYLSKAVNAIGIDLKNGQNILTRDLPDAGLVFHLAAQSRVIPSIADPVHDATTNIIGTIRLAKRYKDSRFVFASSGGCIQEKIESPYGLSKFCAEEYIKLLCKDYVILRLPNIYGDTQSGSVVDLFTYGDVQIFGDGTATRSYVHVDDIVDAIVQSTSWKSGTYSLGSGVYHSVLELAEATGKPMTFLPPRLGELSHTPLENNSPWRLKKDVMEYIHAHRNF
jgi:nucleoside-diphosphate-sugar epimerase